MTVKMPNGDALRAPFPWFGGKSTIAEIVWRRFGNVTNYVEPFFGSGAVLLARPQIGHTETINDKDHFVANFWRATQRDPEAVAHHADWPVNETDLHARHWWLLTEGAARLREIEGEPDLYDAQVAGWWVWGACAWIGSGWCSGRGPWQWGASGWRKAGDDEGNAGQGINRKRPHLGNAGQGINRQLPHLGNAGRGINRQPPRAPLTHQIWRPAMGCRCKDRAKLILAGAKRARLGDSAGAMRAASLIARSMAGDVASAARRARSAAAQQLRSRRPVR